MNKKYSFGNILRYIRRLYSLHVVRFIWEHWFNPLYTLYFNFIFFPFRQAIRFPVFVYGWPKLFSQYGRMECVGCCRTGMVRLNMTLGGAPQYSGGNIELNIWGKVIFRGKCTIASGSRIIVGDRGLLDMGEGTKIMHGCNCTAYSEIRIGAQSWVVHRCQLLDTNFHYIADFKHGVVKKMAHPITIGDYCWICNSATVTGGAVIPDKTIVASNSLVNKDMSDIPNESIIGGMPARLLSTGYRRIESMKLEREMMSYFNAHPDEDVFSLPVGVEHDICDVDALKSPCIPSPHRSKGIV